MENAPGAPTILGRVSLALAVLALVAYLVAGALLLIPVSTPGVQDCGTPAAYLLTGRLDRIPDQEGRILDDDGEIVTLDAAVAQRARERPCQDRVATRAVPAALLLVAATVLGIVAFLVELIGVRPRRRRALVAAAATEAAVATPPGVPPGEDAGLPVS